METAIEAVRQKQIIGYENKPIDMEHLLTFIRQVIRRRRVEEALRESEDKYRTLFESSRDAIMTLAPPTWLFTTGNPATVELFKVKDEAELISIGSWQLSPERQPDGKPSDEKAKEMIETAIRNGSHFFEWTHCHSDGTPFLAEVLLTRMEQRGKVLLQATVRNITDRKQAEEERLTRLQTLTCLNQSISSSLEIDEVLGEIAKATARLMNAPVVTIWTADEKTQILETKAFSDERMHEDFRIRKLLYGQGGVGWVAAHRQPINVPDVFVDKRITNLSWWQTRGLKSFFGFPIFLEQTLIAVLGLGGQKPFHFEPKDQALLENLATQAAVAIKNARLFSETKRLQTQVLESQIMEAIATLAGGVAHEFNNALMGIMGNIELLKMNFSEDEGIDKYLEAMKGSGHRMSRLTDQLLAYAQGGKYQPENLKLDDFVIETLPILGHDFSPTIRVETYFPKDITYIKADHTQMQMVLSAILANSNEAIEDEGLIKITAENKDLDEDFTKKYPGLSLKPGPYVCLTIEDDGKGMDEETRSGIFEPFFTTKFQGRGMGMAAAYGIVKNHDGWISVDSELGKGTVVKIYLPAISAQSREQGAKAGTQPEVELAMGEGTILVIEDEEPLVELFRQVLERLGYRVLQARTGKEAVELAKTFDGQIDLALLDIKLPDMDGGRVYPLIMEARPDLKVVVCSGYSIDGPARAILDAGAEGFIQKPFSIAAFAEKIKEVLEGK
jgi:PAS domain S-box-containing protein